MVPGVLIRLLAILQMVMVGASAAPARETVRVLEGIAFKQVEFSAGSRRVTYEQPSGWRYFPGDAGGLKFYPPGRTSASVTVDVTPVDAPWVFDEAGEKRVHSSVLATIPGAAEEITLLDEERSPLRLGGCPTFGVTYRYAWFGRHVRVHVLLASAEDCAIRITLVCHDADFEELHKELRTSLYGWQLL